MHSCAPEPTVPRKSFAAILLALAAAAGGQCATSTPAFADPMRSAAAVESTRSSVEVTIEVEEPTYDALQQLLDDEARAAMNRGDFPRAWQFFWRLLEIDPTDTRALREAGRVAQALGKLSYSVDALGRYDQLNGSKLDPEVNFLRGEALLALGRKDEAEREFVKVETALAAAPLDRQGTLWLGRIAALRRDLPGALKHYQPLLPDDRLDPAHADITIAIVEAHILSNRWGEAESMLRQLQEAQPDHPRLPELMAWVLSVRGKVDEELKLRRVLAAQWDDHPRKTAEYARALERSYDYPAALARYREAHALGVSDVARDIERLDRRTSPEIVGGLVSRDDPSGDIFGWHVGGTLPLGSWLRVAVTGSQERAVAAPILPDQEVTSTSVAGTLLLSGKRGELAAIGAIARENTRDGRRGVGGTAIMRSSPDNRVQLQLRGDVNHPWRESSSTIREDGVVDAVTAQLSASPWTRRLLLIAGGQARRLQLAPMAGFDDMEPVEARQLLGVVGADYVLYQDPSRIARGEILDNELFAPRAVANALVLSYRHYELDSDNPFGARLVLVERSSVDEASATARHVIDDDGLLALEARGGFGYDRGRDARLWRAGASLLLSATAGSRLTLDYDVASESGTGITGRRHSSWAVLHVDL